MTLFTGIWSRIRERREGAKSSRARILLWATLAALILGGIGMFEPLEDMLRSGRNSLRPQSASGDIVVVAIDKKTLNEFQKWPWPRSDYGKLARELDRLGAKRIIFDLHLPASSDAKGDRAFAETLKDLGRKVTLAVSFVTDPLTGERTENFPAPEFRKHADLGHINFWYNPFGSVWELTYAMDYGGRPYPSLSALLGRKSGAAGQSFPVDYSIDPRTIPSVSAVDLLRGRVAAHRIAGKDVIVGTTAPDLGDLYFLPGHGRMSGVYIHALGGETLRRGTSVAFSWIYAFLAAFLLAVVAISLRSQRLVTGCFVSGIVALMLVPFVLEAHLVFVDILPAVLLLLSAGGSVAWATFKRSYRERGIVNALSGLPNLNALRLEKQAGGRTLIAVRVQNYAEVASALPPDEEKALVEQIASRLTVGAAGHKLYHGDEGIFAWLAEPGLARAIGEHLDALHALFRSPVIVGNNQIDLTLTFGLDAGSDRSLANRLGSALVAADEAAAEGLRWKEYDPAKLKDAAWRLSLLSQLDAAIGSGDLWIAYQPKLDLSTDIIVGAEALVRWTHPEKGPISPVEFILAAEQSDRIEKLTVYVLDRAIAAAAAVNDRGIEFQVSVNLSARLIDHPELASTVTSLLAKHKLPPNRLSLEITETAALTTTGTSLQALLDLRYLGVDISIDDYGTGLSTLDYLKKIPATEIKIDKSFVQAIEKSHSDKLLVHSTIQLAHSLGQKVVAEGVEDSNTLGTLRRMGCDLAQGYLIGRPMNFRSLLKHLNGDGARKLTAAG